MAASLNCPATYSAGTSTLSSPSNLSAASTPRVARHRCRIGTSRKLSPALPASKSNDGRPAMDDNIIRLAELQDSGELSPAAEESLALAYAERHKHELRYVAPFGRWMCYDGTRWNFDNTLHAFDRARDICREVALDCDKAKLATAIASAKTVAAVERLAKADRRLAATADQWDIDRGRCRTT